MGTSGSAPDATTEDTRRVFTGLDEPHAPLTAADVADELDCSERGARRNLDALVERDELRTRGVDDGRVWWRPRDATEPDGEPSEMAEFGAFVRAVEDYAIFTLDPDGTVASWNEGAKRIKGYAEDDIVGEHFSTFYTDEDVAAGVPERNLEAARVQGRVEDEGWRVRADGSRFWADVVITAIRDDDGELQGFTKVTRDMTERREYEQRIRRERNLNSRILETAPVSISVLDADGGFVRANEQALDRLGIDEAALDEFDVDSMDVYDADGDPIPVDERPWQRTLSTGESVTDFECQVDLPELGRRWLSVNTTPLADDQGSDRVVVTVDDVTERKERERELRRERKQTEQLLRTAPVGIAVQNADRETLVANRRAQETFGISEREFRENPVDEGEWTIYDANGEPLDPDETPSARAMATEEPVLGEQIVMETPEGERMHLRVNAAPLFDSDGTIERVVTAGEDVTELKERERQLERRKATLETELSAVFDRISDAFYALDDEWRFTHVNDRAAELMGRSAEELLGQRVWDAFPDAGDGVYREQFRTAMETQQPVTFEVYGDDVDAWLEFSVYPSESGLSIYFRDVTERVEREQTLAKYETIVETVDDGIYVKDEDGYFTMVNDAYAAMTGYDREELVGAHSSLVVDEDAIDRSAELESGADGTPGDGSTMEATLRTADGGELPAEATFATFRTGNGERKHVGVVRDVTERKERRRRIEESERRYRTLVENFPDGAVGLFDGDLEYTAIGGQLLDATGVGKEDRVGSSVSELYPDDIVAEVEPYFHAALDGEASSFEVEFHDRHLFAHTLPVRNGDGEVFAGMLVVQDVTERREAERELRESEAKFRMIAENLEEVVWMTTPDADEFRYINPTFERVWGRDREDLYDDPLSFLEAVHPDDRDRVEAAFTALPDGEFEEEFRIVRPDGEVRWMYVRGALVEDEDSGMARVVGIGEDVTERVERERELERSERRYRTVVENFPNGAVGLVDRDLRYVTIGGNPLTETDLAAEDLEGRAVDDVLSPALADALAPRYRAALEGEASTFEYEHAGGDRHSRFYTFPVRDDSGDVFGALGMSQDVTEQVQREAELEQRARQQAVVANLGQFALETDDLDELMHRAVQRVRDVLGTDYCKVLDLDESEDELLLRQGVGWTDGIVGEATVSSVEARSQAAYTLTNEEPVVVEDLPTDERISGPELLTNHGVTSGISTVIGPFDEPWGILGTHDRDRRSFTDEDVNFVQSVATILADAIERHRNQAELEQLIGRLEESNERLEQFAYAASHDLQEPLRMVSSYLQMIERRYADELDEDGREFIEFAVDGADRMRDMIEGLLRYSRVDTRGDPFEPVDLNDVLDDVRADLGVRIEESGAEISAEDLPVVEGDGGQLRQVFQNLLDNAIEYSGDDPPRVHVSAERDGREWAVCVRDEGIGIDADDPDSVFEVFQRLHAPDDHSGTGIGLALCERIVERHGGEIWVESEPGEGSTFTFTLPVEGGQRD